MNRIKVQQKINEIEKQTIQNVNKTKNRCFEDNTEN